MKNLAALVLLSALLGCESPNQVANDGQKRTVPKETVCDGSLSGYYFSLGYVPSRYEVYAIGEGFNVKNSGPWLKEGINLPCVDGLSFYDVYWWD